MAKLYISPLGHFKYSWIESLDFRRRSFGLSWWQTWRCGWNSCAALAGCFAPIPLSLKSGPHSIINTITLSCSWLTPSILSASPLSPWLVPLLSKLGSAQWNEQHGLNPNDKGQRTEPQLLRDLLSSCRSHPLIPLSSCSYHLPPSFGPLCNVKGRPGVLEEFPDRGHNRKSQSNSHQCLNTFLNSSTEC